VGKTVINVSYCDIAQVRFVGQLMIIGTFLTSVDSILFEQHNGSSPINSIHCVMLYRQNGDRFVTTDSVTSLHLVDTFVPPRSRKRRRFYACRCSFIHNVMLTGKGRSQWSIVVSSSDYGVRGPRFESRHRQLCLSRRPLQYTALGTGCAPLLQYLG